MSKSNYGAEQIVTLVGIEAIRARPGMYIGGVGPEGIEHIILEVTSNSIDESLVGECTEITVEIDTKINEVSILDNGRGIPCGIRESDGKEVLEASCTELHTGAKFTASGETGYNTSGGMHGVGLKCANGLSEYCEVTSVRDGKVHQILFNRGIKESYNVTSIKNENRGTKVRFKPDIEIFKEGITINVAALKKQLIELSFLNKGLQFNFIVDGKKEIIKSDNGLIDYLEYINKGDKITKPFYCETSDNRVGVQIAMLYNSGYSDVFKLYTNSIPNSAGTHLTGFKTALTSCINDYAKEKKMLKQGEDNITGDDLSEGRALCLSLIMPDPVFSGQTKDILSSAEARTIVQRLATKEIKAWLESNPEDAKNIINKALLARRARDAARKAKERTREKDKSVIRTTLPGKLADCSCKKPEDTEVFIVEGDSAAGTAKTARNRTTQAILAVRGKILNSEKASFEALMANEEIKSMIAAFGLVLEKNKISVDFNKLRYHKIIMLSDADVDGR